PRDLDIICLKCLRKEPAERYDSAQALADDLERWLQGEPVQAHPVGPLTRTWKWARRKPALAALAGLCLLSFVLGVAGILWQWQRAETRAEETRKALDLAERHNYYQGVALADREWNANRASLAELSLDGCPPEYRHWEWHYLKRLCRQGVQTFGGHTNEAHYLSIHPHRPLLASAGGQEVFLWDLESGHRLLTWRYTKILNGVRFSPDGRWLAVEISQGGIEIWEVTSDPAAAPQFRRHTHLGGAETLFGALAFSPDSAFLAVIEQRRPQVQLWETATGRLVKSQQQPSLSAYGAIAFWPGNARRI